MWAPWTGAFVDRLKALGWIDGQTVKLEFRWTEGRPELNTQFAQEFAKLNPSVIVADGYPIPNAEKEEEGDYWITFDGNKYRVPSVAVIHNTPNPIGVPIAWLSTMDNRVIGVRCFLPKNES